jgi:DNA modification methylase
MSYNNSTTPEHKVKVDLYLGDCLHTLRKLPDNSVDSIVTDPPYGLSKQPNMAEVLRHWLAGDDYTHTGGGFMGKSWDSFVPGPSVWRECLRVLKPGGHLLAFAGTRTMDLMGLSLRLAGFELRDSIGYAHDDESNGAPLLAWVYGCLSDDAEVLTRDGWERYSTARHKEILAYDAKNDVYQWEKPTRWNEYRVESDTAYRIKSDQTDQIVSRGHRCLVERGGVLAFVSADELASMERVPYLQDDVFTLPQGCGELLLADVLRQGKGLAEATLSKRQGQEMPRQGVGRAEESGVEGRVDVLQAEGQVRRPVDQVRPLSCGVRGDGSQGRLRHGASSACGAGTGPAAVAERVCASHQPRRDGQPAGEPDAVRIECGSQAVRTRPSYRTTLATVTPVEYTGLIFCPTVSTGAFVARRNGKVFVTGNSGFPKNLDVSKQIDKAAGAERVVIGKGASGITAGMQGLGASGIKGGAYDITAPATDAAKQWQGWGTALKPSFEPILIARKPLAGTVAENVQQFGTGAINVDGCRVGNEVTVTTGSASVGTAAYGDYAGMEPRANPPGRWPANFVHDGSEAATAGLGHAARYFYCAKASKRDRDEGCDKLQVTSAADMVGRDEGSDGMNSPRAGAGRTGGARNFHPTVKPTELMRWLVRLVTPPGGMVLDPFTGSGSTGKAAVLEGFNFIGCELGPDYMRIAVARIGHVMTAGKPRVILSVCEAKK